MGHFDVLHHVPGVNEEVVHEPGPLHQHVMQRDGRVGEDHALDRRVADVAFVPQGDVLDGGGGVAAEQARHPAHALAEDGISLVGHRRTPLLPLLEEFLHLEHLGTLQPPDLDGHLLDGGAGKGNGADEFGVAVTLHDLGRHRRGLEPEFLHDEFFRPRVEMGVVAHRSGDLAVGHQFDGAFQGAPPPAEFVVPHEQLEPERGRLGVDPVGAADHDRLLVFDRAPLDGVAQFVEAREQDLSRLLELEGKRRVEQVGAGQPQVDVA